MRDILVVGEALVDIVERLDGSRSEHPGGSPANVALGLARLGRTVHLVTRLGPDERGRRIRAHLQDSGVWLVPGSVTNEPTSTATARIDAQGVAQYEFAIDWRVATSTDLTAYQALHVGSIASFLPPGGDDVVRLVEAAFGQLTVSYDPNVRPALMGDPVAARSRVEHLVTRANVVKVSDEDLAWLAPGEDPQAVARRWQASGPAVVVVTRGGAGAWAVAAVGEAEHPGLRVEVVDTVGAGDSFMSALLDYLAGEELLGVPGQTRLHGITQQQLQGLLDHATRVAAVTCTRAGAEPPTRAELARSRQPWALSPGRQPGR